MRPLAPALAVPLASLVLACGSGSSASGKGAGEACGSAGECSAGLVCFERICAATYAAAPGCAPTGTPRIVSDEPVVIPEPPPGACLTAVRAPTPAGDFLDLGVRQVGEVLSFEVPPGTSSLTITSQEVDGSAVDTILFQGFLLPNTVVPTGVLLPDETLFFSDTDPYPQDAEGYDDVTGTLAFYAGFTAISGSFTLPNTARSLDLVRTAGEVPAGTWKFQVNDWARECLVDFAGQGCEGGSTAGRYQIHVEAKPGPFASTGTLDLEIYLVTDPAGPLPDAETAERHPQVERFVRGLSEYFANAGICLGTVTFRDLPAWVKERYAPSGIVDVSGVGSPGCDDLSQLFAAGIAPSRGVHLFLAEELLDESAGAIGTVLGIDGSIPGPSGFPGTIHGGAILGLLDFLGAEVVRGACDRDAPLGFDCGTDWLSYVAAHEAGHWLGLYHTTEFHGASFDPLSDTGTCPCLSCAPRGLDAACAETGSASPVPVEASFCASPSSPILEVARRAVPSIGCSGAQNLMFWQVDATVAEGRLSRQQGEVMRLNPAVR